VVGAEFCGTSITSQSGAQARVDAARRFNPHVRYARSDERGYVSFALGADRLEAKLRVVNDALDANSGIRTAAQFAVEAGKPGVQAG
jgi:alkaline phosphatase D